MFAEEPLAGINKHELLRALARKETSDVGTQTEVPQGSNAHPLFESLLQGLEEIVHTGLTSTHVWDNSPPLELRVHDTDSSDSSASESPAEEIGKLNIKWQSRVFSLIFTLEILCTFVKVSQSRKKQDFQSWIHKKTVG